MSLKYKILLLMISTITLPTVVCLLIISNNIEKNYKNEFEAKFYENSNFINKNIQSLTKTYLDNLLLQIKDPIIYQFINTSDAQIRNSLFFAPLLYLIEDYMENRDNYFDAYILTPDQTDEHILLESDEAFTDTPSGNTVSIDEFASNLLNQHPYSDKKVQYILYQHNNKTAVHFFIMIPINKHSLYMSKLSNISIPEDERWRLFARLKPKFTAELIGIPPSSTIDHLQLTIGGATISNNDFHTKHKDAYINPLKATPLFKTQLSPLRESTLAVSSQGTEFYSMINNIKTTLLSVIIANSLFILFFSYYLIKQQVTAPINRLNQQTSKIGRDNWVWDLSSNKNRTDEIGQLYNRFKELVSRLQQSYQSLEQSNEALEDKVKERTEHLVQANRTKSAFLANMSHELRTPINGIIGLSELLNEEDLTSKSEELVNNIVISGENLLSTVNDILDFTKIESGSMPIEYQPNNLVHCIKHIHELLLPVATKKEIHLNFTADDKINKFYLFDRHRLTQVITNICSNAIKFTDIGEVNIVLNHCPPFTASPDTSTNEPVKHLTDQSNTDNNGNNPSNDKEIKSDIKNKSESENKREREKEYVQITVIDTGVGINETEQKRIFEPFVQEDASVSRRFGGTGLGLAISHKIITLLNGTISLTSTKGKGTTVTIKLPLEVASIQHETKTQSSINQQDLSQLKDLRVLVAEDNPINQMLCSKLLEKAGCQFQISDNGAKAVAAVVESDFDIILMDMQMPIISGIEACRLIRKVEVTLQKKATYIIALTANVLEEHERLCRQVGMNDFLRKPYKQVQLYQRLNGYFTTHSLSDLPTNSASISSDH